MNNLFDLEVRELMSLSTGLTATKKDGINSDDVESVGSKIQQQMDGVVFSEVKITKASHVKTLEDLKPSVIVAGRQVHIDPAVLMLRCQAVAKRMDNGVESYCQYELTAVPTSLFSNNFMRQGQKLATELLVVPATPRLSVPETLSVIDGGWLLDKMCWETMTTFGTVYSQYVDYLSEHFGPSVVILDGYSNSTKDHEHLCCQQSSKKRENKISINPDIQTTSNQDTLFAKVENKVSLIGELSLRLENEGQSVLHCPADANTMLVAKAMNLCKNKQPVMVVAKDTDILVMLIYHWEDGLADLCMQRKTFGKNGQKHIVFRIYAKH